MVSEKATLSPPPLPPRLAGRLRRHALPVQRSLSNFAHTGSAAHLTHPQTHGVPLDAPKRGAEPAAARSRHHALHRAASLADRLDHWNMHCSSPLLAQRIRPFVLHHKHWLVVD